ncbi:MAG: aldose 1-epimerase [Geminicoccaceae bacterium]
MADRKLIELRRGAFELGLCPSFGGAITRFRHAGRDLLRPAGAPMLAGGDPGSASCFPLVPFSNRIADARFRFQGRTYRLPRNFPPEPHAIHGQGWQNPWEVGHVGAGRAELAFRHAVAGTPLDYRARQVFALEDDGLAVRVEVTNAGGGPMPAGVGQHAYFMRTDTVTLRARLGHVWLADARKIPERRVPVPPGWDLAKAPRVAALELDNCFDGWDGRAELAWPELDLTLRIEAEPLFGHLVVYVPPGEDFFCVEPVSNVNDGFNLFNRGVPGTGVRVLAPGARLAGTIRFRIV